MSNEMEGIKEKEKIIDSEGLSVSSLEESPKKEKEITTKTSKIQSVNDEKQSKKEVFNKFKNWNKKKLDDKLIAYKKLLRTAGVHIKNYEKFFDGCKSERQKIEKIKSKLREIGHADGRITIQSCQKLKEKNEQKAELEELSQNVILDGIMN